MFSGCTSLKAAPILPSPTVVEGCYNQMFSGCTSLTSAPELPATTLADYCYKEMFKGCSTLNSVTCLATDISAAGCVTNWLSGVASAGTFTKAAAMNDWPIDNPSGIPTGWTVKSQGSAVPEGFVTVSGGTYDGSAALTPTSSVFTTGKTVTIGNLYVSDHEVTQKEYKTYCKYGGTDVPSATYGVGDSYPAYYVNWYDAVVYCNLRSKAEGLTPAYKIGTETDPTKWSGIVGDASTKWCGPSSSDDTWNGMTFDTTANGYRLPTEAEWEYIARNKNQDSYTYSGSDTIDDVAWYGTNSLNKTHEVKTDKVAGTDSANGLGIYDMSGNVWEWCGDTYTNTSKRNIRGGAWSGTEVGCRVFNRNSINTYERTHSDLGFRVVRNAP